MTGVCHSDTDTSVEESLCELRFGPIDFSTLRLLRNDRRLSFRYRHFGRGISLRIEVRFTVRFFTSASSVQNDRRLSFRYLHFGKGIFTVLIINLEFLIFPLIVQKLNIPLQTSVFCTLNSRFSENILKYFFSYFFPILLVVIQ